MILLIDIGNSRVKWAPLMDGRLGPAQAAAYHDVLQDEFWPQLFQDQPVPRRVVVASVAGEAMVAALAAWSRDVWRVEVEPYRTTASAAGVSNGYAVPARLGVDRWLAMIGARAGFPGTLCVVDCGTALTVDAINDNGKHLGGWIAPGIGMMQSSLLDRTQGVRLDTAVESDGGTFGHDTTAAVRGGTCHAAAGLVYQALSLLQSMGDGVPRCVVTGGDALALLALLPRDSLHVPDLVLRGLGVVAQAADTEMHG